MINDYKREDDNALNRTKIFMCLRNWIGQSNYLRGQREDSEIFSESVREIKDLLEKKKIAKPFYKREIIKKLRRYDFLRTYIIICDMVFRNIADPDERKIYIKNVIGSTIGRIVFETIDIKELHSILEYLSVSQSKEFSEWLRNRRLGKTWVENTFIEDFIDLVLNEDQSIAISELSEDLSMTYEDFAKYEFALVSGSSNTDVDSMMARGVSRTSLCNIFYGYLMVRRLMEILGDNLYLTWYGDGEMFSGHSGIKHYFDGIIVLNEDDKDDPWLLKCVSTTHNPLVAIESANSKLNDIGMNKCILFIPMYPSENALRYSVYSYLESRNEIIILYLHDLYKIYSNQENKLVEYLNSRRIH